MPLIIDCTLDAFFFRRFCSHRVPKYKMAKKLILPVFNEYFFSQPKKQRTATHTKLKQLKNRLPNKCFLPKIA